MDGAAVHCLDPDNWLEMDRWGGQRGGQVSYASET